MPSKFVEKVIEAFSKLKGEIDEKRGELDFRHSLANYFLRDVLGWGRKKGKGHYEIRELEDIRLFDSSNRCVALIETKNPRIARLTDKHRTELKEHLSDYKGTANYGALTNGHEFQLFEYTGEGELNELASIDIDVFVEKGVEALSKTERQKVHLLRRLRKDRFVEVSPEYFRKTAHTIKIEEPRNFDLFIEDLKGSLDELTRVIYERFFKFYWEAGPNHYGGKFLREEAFRRWKGASVGKEEELMEKFCKETAYVILNRILFTRILEDKGIVKRMISGEGIADLLKWGEGAYEMALKQAYKNVEKFYEHFYEFGIFDWWRLPEDKLGMLTDEEKRIQKEIEDEFNTVVVRDILKRLNQFDFREVRRDTLGDVYQEYLPPAERKRLGEFYTPIEVVRYILDAVGYTPENNLEDKTLLDPACGSGTFLVEATSRLIERHDKKGARLRDPDDCKRILENIINNIHGLDINPFACHIAEMNLLFTIIDLLHAVQRRYKNYKLERFDVCQTDSLLPPGEEPTTISEFVNGRIKSWTEEAGRANRVKRSQFDFIVGNPPYVRVQTLPKEAKERYSKIYSTASGNYDIYIPFIERGVMWFSNSGKLGYINPNRFATVNYGKKLRKFLAENVAVREFLDFRDTGVFKDVLNYPTIMILAKQRGKGDIIKVCRMVHKPKDIDDKEILSEIKQHLHKVTARTNFFTTGMFDVFGYDQKFLDDSGWYLMPPAEQDVFRKVEKNSIPLADISKTKKSGSALSEGSSTGAKKIYVVRRLRDTEGLSEVLCYNDGNTYKIESGLLKRYIEDSGKWCPSASNEFIIFPYFKKNHQYKIMLNEKFARNYPSAWRYFNLKKDKLIKRKGFGNKSEWHAYSAPRSLDYYEEKKILIQGFSVFSNASIDKNGEYFFGPDIYGLRVKDKYEGWLPYILAIINSSLTNFYIRHVGVVHGGGYYKFEDRFIKSLPVKLPKTPKEKKTAVSITKKVEQITDLTRQLDDFKKKIKNFPDAYAGKDRRKLSEVVKDYKNLKKDKYKIKFLQIKKTGKDFYKLSLDEDNYVIFASREMAEYVLGWLKRRKQVRRSELLGLEVPVEHRIARIMGDFSSDKKRVEETRKEVEKLEGEIDELVYVLYGLDAKDQEVIEEFLKKF